MGIKTKIPYCDSTCNGEMGCDGCELWIPGRGIRRCYAGNLIEGPFRDYPHVPSSFTAPQLYPERITEACGWSDLYGKQRKDKPWLDNWPRIIFFNDMGDTFTKSLDMMWCEPYLEQMAASPHIWLWFTKWPFRMRNFFETIGEIPNNFWLGTSITASAYLTRAEYLLKIDHPYLFLSLSPLVEQIPRKPLADILLDDRIGWLLLEGEAEFKTGNPARPTSPAWVRETFELCERYNVARFLKQWGNWKPAPITASPDQDQQGQYIRMEDGSRLRKVENKTLAGQMLDGQLFVEMPAWLQPKPEQLSMF